MMNLFKNDKKYIKKKIIIKFSSELITNVLCEP